MYTYMAASNTYEKVTETIIAALEEGNVIWQKPWKSLKPCNAITGKPYRGINPFLLHLGGMNYSDHRWVTYKQALELGGNVKKGEKGTWIVFSSPTIKKNDAGEVTGKYWLMRAYTVFNVEQCENLAKLPVLEDNNKELGTDDTAEALWNQYLDKPEVLWGSEAFYVPSQDKITMPRRETFVDNAHFYATLFHEGAHSTGHSTRLNRKGITEATGFGSDSYSLEELVAEFTAAFLCAEAGLDMPTRENTIAYLQGWIKRLKEDKTLVVKAASAAQQAADYMMGIRAKNTEEPGLNDTVVTEEKSLVAA